MARQAESFRGRCGTWSWPRTCGWAGRSWGSSGLALLSHQCQGSAEAASPTLVYASLGPSRAPMWARPTLATTNAGRLAPVCPLGHGGCPWFATAATAWVTALVAACCQATRGCASTSPCRGGRRGSGCYCYGRRDSGTASYGAGKRAKESAGDVVPPRSGHVRASIASTTWPGGCLASMGIAPNARKRACNSGSLRRRYSRVSRYGPSRGSPGAHPAVPASWPGRSPAGLACLGRSLGDDC